VISETDHYNRGASSFTNIVLEIVADYMKRPLLPLTCGDMGITASEVQENITKYFELGERWGAVILMDEADIYLEQRAPDQLERNSLVSGISLRFCEVLNVC
jgi:hypothetical protein